MFLPMLFVMFAFNALHASPSLLWHLTAVGGRVCGEGGPTLEGFLLVGRQGRHQERAWGRDRRMQMIYAGQRWHSVPLKVHVMKEGRTLCPTPTTEPSS